MINRMILNGTSYFGSGAIHSIVAEIKTRGFKKALVVTDKDLIKFSVATKVTDILKENGLDFDVYDAVVPNPTVNVVHSGVSVFRQSGADYLIAIGGGSPQDTSKAIGMMVANPHYADVRMLEGAVTTKNPSVPIIAIPTTSGTAAEVTINYVITDEEKRRKFVCCDPHDIPQIAVIDPDMMSSMPAGLKAATGVDALTHAIEGYITVNAWELTDMFHLKAIEIIGRSLRDSVKGDPKGLADMALGQYIAGMGFSNVGLGLVHGMAHPLGAFYGTPHGVANAILLPHVMRFNAPSTGEKYRDIAHALGVKEAYSKPLNEARELAIEAVFTLNRDIGIPTRLRDVGMKEEDAAALAASAMTDACTPGNPRACDEERVRALYLSVY